jgi:protein-S-isoprenylcysteine O-methyltransferase Ste14
VVYLLHGLFFSTFVLRLLWAPPASGGRSARDAVGAAPGSWALVAFHGLGFGIAYFGIGAAVFGRRPATWLLPPLPGPGAAMILVATGLAAWALLVFRSWRLEARIDAGHELCTRGPFGLVRHPIYLATDLLFLGTVIWLPTLTVVLGALVSLAAADLRARAEERLLAVAFGDEYTAYSARVRRFVPGIY